MYLSKKYHGHRRLKARIEQFGPLRTPAVPLPRGSASLRWLSLFARAPYGLGQPRSKLRLNGPKGKQSRLSQPQSLRAPFVGNRSIFFVVVVVVPQTKHILVVVILCRVSESVVDIGAITKHLRG